ncbi:hypothetical protein KVT40_008670 [Elsinoe batatas]|uniref:FAS1 domain-containing protein n=1 Tax=Elsinoe batatas TaxID=2601811 RepID=A0A8K0KVV7_9PEZI|nr:hypothetical protein KVT40_008670 [Elsinoe batatas]
MLLSTSSVLLFAGLGAAQNALVDFITSQPDLSFLADVLTIVPELVTTLGSANNITIFAPTNTAFEAIPPDTAEGLAISTRDPNGTSTLLNYHVLRGGFPSSAFTETPLYYPTLFDNRSIIFNNARTNVTGGQNVGLFRNGTQFQVISGELQTSNVIEADLTLGSVIVHKIDEVLTIPLNASDTAERLNATAALGALTLTGLADPLDIVPDLTLFIPVNEAFQAAASAFEGASVETLRDVLQYHAITGNVIFSSEITNTTAQASNGGTLTFSVIDDKIYVNTARVLIPNVLLSDGVAHVIDTVLNPANSNVDREEIDDDDTPTPAFSGASPTGGVPFTSAVPAATTGTGIGGATRSPSGTSSAPISSFTGAAAMPTMVGGGALFAGVALAGAWELGF